MIRSLLLLAAVLLSNAADAQQAAVLQVLPSPGKSAAVVKTTSAGRWIVLAGDLSPVPSEAFKRSAEAGGGSVLIFEATAGKYTVVFVPDNIAEGLAATAVVLGGTAPANPTQPDPPPTNPPPVTTTGLHVTLVYEKDQGPVRPAVAAALAKLNQQAIDAGRSAFADEFEEDTTDGDGQVPDQFRLALEAARKAGLPALVVVSGGKVMRVVKDPRTEADVLEAVK